MAESAGRPIAAAGGVVWRIGDAGTEVLLVHRPRYDDWTLPKGTVRRDEPALLAAVREVGEETGLRVAVQQRLRSARYTVDGARKKVNYWSMRCTGGEFAANDEVDAVDWVGIDEAARRLTHDTDREIVRDVDGMPLPDAVLVLVRHAKAGRRADWWSDDRLRPLDANGERQAELLATLLSAFAPTDIWSADLLRCEQTVAPLARRTGLDITVESAFSDAEYDDGPDGTALRLLALAKPGRVSVVCSQGTAIPGLIDRLGPGVRSSETRKAAWWVLPVVDGEVVVADRYDAP